MKFKTKGELLEYLGKNRTDNKLVDRMIIRWEVNKTSEGYEYNTPAEDFSEREKELMDKIDGLEFTLDLKESQIESLQNEIDDLKKTSWGNEYDELKVNYEYLQQKFRRLKRGYELVIQLTYKYAAKNMKITKEEYKEQLSEEVNEVLSEEMGREE